MGAAKARRWLDPMTGDYVVENGGPRGDDTHASQIVLRLRMKRGSSAANPKLGSRLHLIKKATPGARLLAESYVWEAIDDLVTSRVIRDVTVGVKVVSVAGGAAFEIEVGFKDSAGVQRTARYTSRIGG